MSRRTYHFTNLYTFRLPGKQTHRDKCLVLFRSQFRHRLYNLVLLNHPENKMIRHWLSEHFNLKTVRILMIVINKKWPYYSRTAILRLAKVPRNIHPTMPQAQDNIQSHCTSLRFCLHTPLKSNLSYCTV